MVPNPLYELLPYLYLLSGSLVIATIGGYAIVPGLLLFSLGAWSWLMRSDYRRVNSRRPKLPSARLVWGDSLYELQPFFYILLGVLIFGFLNHPIRLLSGPLMVIVGSIVLALRASERRKPKERTLAKKVETRETVADASLPFVYSNFVLNRESLAVELAEDVTERVTLVPSSSRCSSCQIVDICASVKLKPRAVQEIMRLSQTLSPDGAFSLYREVVERIEGRKVSNDELRAVLNLLYRYSDLCITWRKTGRLAPSLSRAD